MKRSEFLKDLGLSAGALMAVYCLGTTMTACTNSKSNDPTPTPPTGGTGGTGGTTKVDFTLNLDDPANADLKGTKAYLIKDNVIVARTKNNAYVALTKICTHQGSTIEFQANNDRFYCPDHGSLFRTDGTVLGGPASLPLKVYKTTLTGSSLRVSES